MPSCKSIKRFRDKVRAMLHHKTRTDDPVAKVMAMNRVTRGWSNYFRHVNAMSIINQLDHWVFQILLAWLTAHHGQGVRKTETVCTSPRKTQELGRQADRWKTTLLSRDGGHCASCLFHRLEAQKSVPGHLDAPGQRAGRGPTAEWFGVGRYNIQAGGLQVQSARKRRTRLSAM
ncbi:MAG: group II intron maturase-specific domain-containing protein [Anaerolineae bacterium]